MKKETRRQLGDFLARLEEAELSQKYCIVLAKDASTYVMELDPRQAPQDGADGSVDEDDQLIVFYGPPFLADFYNLLRRTGEENLGDSFVAFLAKFGEALLTVPREPV